MPVVYSTYTNLSQSSKFECIAQFGTPNYKTGGAGVVGVELGEKHKQSLDLAISQEILRILSRFPTQKSTSKAQAKAGLVG